MIGEQEFRGHAGCVVSSLPGLASFLALVLGYYLSPSGLGWSAGENFFLDFWFLCNIRASTSVYHESAAATGGGRNESRGQGPRGFVSTSEAPILVHRRAAMTSPQRHRDGRDNSQLISGDGPAPTPCPKCHGGEDSCETKPISGCAGWGEAWGTAAVEGDRAKQSQFGPGCPETDAGRQTWGPCRGRLRKTDPILRRGLSCETKPIAPWKKSGEDAQPTKRRMCETKPNLGRLGYLGDWTRGTGARGVVQTNPISRSRRVGRGHRRVGRGANVQNEPNSSPGSRWRRYPTIPVFHHSTVPILCRSCETKPIAFGDPLNWPGRSATIVAQATDLTKD